MVVVVVGGLEEKLRVPYVHRNISPFLPETESEKKKKKEGEMMKLTSTTYG